MKLTIENANSFKELISILNSIINEGKFVFDGKKLKLRAVDSANICLIELELGEDFFLETEGEGSFIVKLENLKDALKKAKKSDVITLELDKTNNKLKVILKSGYARRFYIPLIHEELEEIPESDLKDFKAKIEMDSKEFKEIIENIESVSETVEFSANENNFIIRAKEDLEEVEIELEKTNEILLKYEVSENCKSLFGIDYLKKVIKMYKISPTVSIQIGETYPVKIEYNNGDTSRATFIIAPKID